MLFFSKIVELSLLLLDSKLAQLKLVLCRFSNWSMFPTHAQTDLTLATRVKRDRHFSETEMKNAIFGSADNIQQGADVQRILGHKRIDNTEIYTHLIEFENDEWTVRRPQTSKEEDELIEADFQYVRYDDKEGYPIYKKRK